MTFVPPALPSHPYPAAVDVRAEQARRSPRARRAGLDALGAFEHHLAQPDALRA